MERFGGGEVRLGGFLGHGGGAVWDRGFWDCVGGFRDGLLQYVPNPLKPIIDGMGPTPKL